MSRSLTMAMLPLILVRTSILSLPPPFSLAVGVIAVVAIAYLFFVFKVRRAPKTSGSTVSPGAPSNTVAHARLTPAAKPPAGGTVQMTQADAALVHALRKADLHFGGLQVAAPKPPKPTFHPSVTASTRAKA